MINNFFSIYDIKGHLSFWHRTCRKKYIVVFFWIHELFIMRKILYLKEE